MDRFLRARRKSVMVNTLEGEIERKRKKSAKESNRSMRLHLNVPLNVHLHVERKLIDKGSHFEPKVRSIDLGY